MKKTLLLVVLALTLSIPGFSWIYPEHRDIMMIAIQKLDAVHRAQLEKYWSVVRKGHEDRLFPISIDTSRSENPKFIDYAAWPAISGDHSTSSANMLDNVLKSDWIIKVAGIAMELRHGLANARNRSDRNNKLRDSDIRLLRADPEYVTRAGANNVHFMLARPSSCTSQEDYFIACLRGGADLNALGTYAYYHLSALIKARKFLALKDKDQAAAGLITSALADEAFADHFLEDMFASGHVAGTWGNAAQRKGTHDYYDEKGIEVCTWSGGTMVLMGDAFMRPEDAERAAVTVKMSLEEVLDAATGSAARDLRIPENVIAGPDTFNVAKNIRMPFGRIDSVDWALFKPVLMPTAIPGLAKGAGELPRFRSELGPFIGLTAAARANVLFSGFDTYQKETGVNAGLEMAVRLGLGLEGLLNEGSDGLVFLDLGWRIDGSSSMKMTADPDLKQFGSMFSAVPSRDAFYARIRMPFYLIPGDLIIVAPFLYLFSPKSATKMIIAAGNGGLLPWQSGMVTPIGRFQFVLGREVGIYLYGWPKSADRFLLPFANNLEADQVLVSMRSTLLEFPFIEYRPFHTFSTNQTASLVLQFFGGVDIPGKITVVAPEGSPVPKTNPIYFLGVRIGFDWRYYFGKNGS
jgi:hypothetical protein